MTGLDVSWSGLLASTIGSALRADGHALKAVWYRRKIVSHVHVAHSLTRANLESESTSPG
jgi:hypothetical protein